MEQIRNLCRYNGQQLRDKLVEAAEAARDAGTEEEEQESLDLIGAIIYTLERCAYEGRNPEE